MTKRRILRGRPNCILVKMGVQTVQQYPDKEFYLSVVKSLRRVDHVEINDVKTLQEAIEKAQSMGYHPTHWIDCDQQPFQWTPLPAIEA